ncbi:hypothetical protein M422DRAFT_205290 [Sphaerobolus stellatus SS14]|nr:hypothetical protein M422DRAFT_205290 [Sphaerobolus stellatus SS14]
MVFSKAVAVLLLVFPLFSAAVPSQIPFGIPESAAQDAKTVEYFDESLPKSSLNVSFHDSYHPLWETNGFLEHLALTYPENLKLEEVGKSAGGRSILAAAISNPELKKNKKKKLKQKPRFVMIGAQHAREWIATSTALYLTHALLVDEKEPWSLRELLDDFDFFIIPSPNPDGYEYTWTTDRFWYKNTMPVDGQSDCRGIDMNRNWGFGWERQTSPKPDPCAHWYPGERPFQAPEVAALSKYFKKLKDVTAFIDLRSYGQTISTPYSYTCDKMPPDEEDILEAAHGAAAAVRHAHGTSFKVGRLCSTLYQAPGNILDWMYEKKGVKYSYAVHLRDTGTYGYLLPSEWIRPVGEETGRLVSYLVEFIHEKKKAKSKKHEGEK